MSDHIEHECKKCGSFLHFEEQCTRSETRNEKPKHICQYADCGYCKPQPTDKPEPLPPALVEFVIDMTREYGPEAGEGARLSAEAAWRSCTASAVTCSPEPVAYAWRSKRDGSYGDRIEPVGYVMHKERMEKLRNDHWVRKGAAEIVPLYAEPFTPSATACIPRRSLQAMRWAGDIFGLVARDQEERAMRFAEEAIELAHASGLRAETLASIAERVYDRKPGDVHTEVGQAMLTLEMLGEVLGVVAEQAAEREFNRVKAIPKEEWERRHQAKVDMGIAK